MRIWIVVLLFCSCTPGKERAARILNKENLPSQAFIIHTGRDTTLITSKGCIIKIPAGTFITSNSLQKIIVKEALTTSDIILAGLSTTSNGKLLSSGGMIFIGAENGTDLRMRNAINVWVPANRYVRDMQVFKGDRLKDETINWIDPLPLIEDSIREKIANGEMLFKSQCSNCHKTTEDYTGPSLYGVTDRLSRDWLYKFTRDPAGSFRRSLVETSPDSALNEDRYALCLLDKWKVVMTSYPQLTDDALDAIYSYTKAESDKMKPWQGEKTFCDSFAADRTMAVRNIQLRNNFLSQTISVPGVRDTLDEVSGPFYQMQIQQLGWFNIDYFIQEDKVCKQVSLLAFPAKSSLEHTPVILVIPAYNIVAYAYGNNNGSYYFKEKDGKVIIPLGVQCYIVAMDETNDSVNLGVTPFVSALQQKIRVDMKPVSKDKFVQAIRAIK